MRHLATIIALVTVLGCASRGKREPRLNGTWQLNPEDTVAEILSRDPDWTEAPPYEVERFRAMFTPVTLTYSNGVVTAASKGDELPYKYTVKDRGNDYVVIRVQGATEDVRIRFVDEGQGYTITDTGEKFDKVFTEPASGANTLPGEQPR